MKNFRKVAALVVAFAMVMSLCSFGAFADGETKTLEVAATATGVGIGDSFEVTYTLSDNATNAVTVRNVNFEIPYDEAKIKVEKVEGIASVKPSTKNGVVKFLYADTEGVGTEVSKAKAVAKIKVTVLDGSSIGDTIALAPSEVKYSVPDDATTYKDVVIDGMTAVTVIEKYDVKAVKDAEVTAAALQYGATAADVVAYLNANVKTVEVTEPAGKGSVAVKDWTAPADYDAKKKEAQTFTATLDVDGNTVTNTGNVSAAAKVTLSQIDTADMDVVAETTLMVKKEGEAAYTKEDVEKAVKDAIGASITVKKVEITDVYETYTAVVDGELKATNVDDVTAVKVTVTGESKDKFFKLADKTATVNVKIVPNVLSDVSWELSTSVLGLSRSFSVKINGYDKKYNDAKVVAEVTLDKTGKTEKVELGTLAALADDSKADASFSAGSIKALFADAAVGDTVTIKVMINDAPVVIAIGSEEVTRTVTLRSTNSGSSVSGLPVGGTDKPATDEPATDDPATDDPATDEPATDEPATDEPATGIFTDVPAEHWAASYIKAMKDLGIVGGVTADTFAPDNNITRAEFAKMVALSMGLDVTKTESAFEDCPADAWYTPYVVACAEAGYVKGVSDVEYGAEANITRQDICTILGRIVTTDVEITDVTFTDASDIADYAMDAVKMLVSTGVLNGYEDGTFGPTAFATRAEVCKILSTVLAGLAVEEEETTEEVVEEEVATEDETAAEEDAAVEEEVVAEDEEVVAEDEEVAADDEK